MSTRFIRNLTKGLRRLTNLKRVLLLNSFAQLALSALQSPALSALLTELADRAGLVRFRAELDETDYAEYFSFIIHDFSCLGRMNNSGQVFLSSISFTRSNISYGRSQQSWLTELALAWANFVGPGQSLQAMTIHCGFQLDSSFFP